MRRKEDGEMSGRVNDAVSKVQAEIYEQGDSLSLKEKKLYLLHVKAYIERELSKLDPPEPDHGSISPIPDMSEWW